MQSIGGNMNVFAYSYQHIGESDISSACDQIRMDMMLMPEKQCVLAATADKSECTDGSILAKYTESKYFPFSYSHMQRQVGFLTIRLTEITSKKKLSNRSSLLGGSTLDLCSLVFKKQLCLCHMPVYRQNTSTGSSFHQEVVGWALVAFSMDSSIERKALETACHDYWQQTSQVTSRNNPLKSSLSITVGDLQSYTGNANGEIRLELTCLSPFDYPVASFDIDPAHLSPCPRHAFVDISPTSAAVLLEVIVEEEGVPVGRGCFPLSSLWLISGRPVELALPLRNVRGERVCLLPLAAHLSSITHALTNTPSSTLSSGLSLATQHQSSAAAKDKWIVDISQPQVFDPSWRFDLQLGFEICLSLLRRGEDDPLTLFGAAWTNDGADSYRCALEGVPPVEEILGAAVSIVCRDISRPTYPEVVRGRTDALPLLMDGAQRAVRLDTVTESIDKVFEKRGETRSSCYIVMSKQSSNQSSVMDASTHGSDCSVASIRLYFSAIFGEDSLLEESANILKLTVSSSIDKQQSRRWGDQLDARCKYFASVAVCGSEGSLRVDVELANGIFSGELALSELFSCSNTPMEILVQSSVGYARLRLLFRPVIVPHVSGRLRFTIPKNSLTSFKSSIFMRAQAGAFPPIYIPLNEDQLIQSSGASLFLEAWKLPVKFTLHLVDTNKPLSSLDLDCEVGRGIIDIDTLIYESVKSACSVSNGSDCIIGSAGLTRTIAFHNNQNNHILTVPVELLFVLENISANASAALSSCEMAHSNNFQQKVQVELGLKQSFIAADIDSSGFVTYDEIVDVFRSQLRRKKRQDGRGKQVEVALLDSFELLLRLCGDDIDTADVSDSALITAVRKVLRKLDLDGDGRVSWEEWLQVLRASVLERNPDSLINPLDPFIVRLAGAISKISSRKLYLVIPVQIVHSNYHSLITRGIIKSSTKAPSNFVSSILSMKSVSSARNTNILTHFEDEMAYSPQYSPQGQPITRPDYKNNSRVESSFLETIDFEEKLRLGKISKHLRKKSKLRNAKRSLAHFAKKLVPRLHNQIYRRKIEQLHHLLRGLITRRKFRKTIAFRSKCCLVIQRSLRGYLARKRLVAIQYAALKLQRVMRGYSIRKLYKEIKTRSILVALMRRKCAIRIIKKFARICGIKRKHYLQKAALSLQCFWRKSTAVRLVQDVNRRRIEEQCRQNLRHSSASDIQKIFRGKRSRNEYLQKIEEIRVNRLEEERVAREKESMNRILETSSATKIQSHLRKRKGVKRYKLLQEAEKKEIQEQMLLRLKAEKENLAARIIQSQYRIERRRKYNAAKAEMALLEAMSRAKITASANRIQKFYAKKMKSANEKSKLELKKNIIDAKEGKAASIIQGAYRNHLVVRSSMSRPCIQETVGRSIEVRVGPSLREGVYRGKIIAFFEETKIIRIKYATEESSGVYIEDLSYFSRDILWKSNVPPPLEDSIGYEIEVAPIVNGKVSSVEYSVAKILSVDLERNTILVEYVVNVGYAPEVETLSFYSHQIVCWKAPPISLQPKLIDCLNFDLEIAVLNDGIISPDEYFMGTVISVNEKKNRVIVVYESDEDQIPQVEELRVDSALIIKWIHGHASASSCRRIVRPSIERSVGSLLYIGLECDPDMLVKVVSIDIEFRKMEVVFINHSETSPSVVIPYQSRDIIWLQRCINK